MRLIDADVIISQCKEYSNLLKYDGTTDREWALVKRMILMINEQPTIEPERTGRWIDRNDNIATCSICGSRWGLYRMLNYCPNCGAMMKEN